MGKKILIAYATRYGSTEITSTDLKKHLESIGHEVELINLKKSRLRNDLNSFDLIVAGSSVAMFSWMASVKRLLRKCKKISSKLVVFISCGSAIESSQNGIDKFLMKVINRLGVKPDFYDALPPVIDFRPESALNSNTKNTIKNTIKAFAKENYDANGLMDFRPSEIVNNFFKNVENLL